MENIQPWIVGNNGLDLHESKSDFTEIATFFDKSKARLGAMAPEMFNILAVLVDRPELDPADRADIINILQKTGYY